MTSARRIGCGRSSRSTPDRDGYQGEGVGRYSRSGKGRVQHRSKPDTSALKLLHRSWYRDLALELDPDATADAEQLVAQTILEQLDAACYEVRMVRPPAGHVEWSPREHLRHSIGFAIGRLPKDWLRRLQKEPITDDVKRWAAERIVEQIELSNIRYEQGPPSDAAAQIGSKLPPVKPRAPE
jgi:hypothetical protein